MEKQTIRITLHHDGNLNGLSPNDIEAFLEEVWSQFGLLGQTSYDAKFQTCELQYINRPRMLLAKAGLSDPIQVQAAIANVVKDNQANLELSKKLFVGDKPSEMITVAWSNSTEPEEE